MTDSPFRTPSPIVTLPDKWKFTTLREILDNPPPPEPPWRIRGMMAEGCGTQISSQPHGMKSYTWLQAMIEASLGIPVWGHFESLKVKHSLFLETEDPEWLVYQRVHRIAKGLNLKDRDIENCHFVTGILGPFDLVKCRDLVRRVLDDFKPDIATLSTLQGLLGGRDWKEQSEMAEVNALLVELSQQYCPLSVITHSPQDKKQRRAAGTITQAANFQNILHYEKHGSQVNVHLDSKLSEGESFRIKVEKSTPDSIRFRWARMDGKERMLAFIKEHPEMGTKELAENLDCSDRYIRELKQVVPTSLP